MENRTTLLQALRKAARRLGLGKAFLSICQLKVLTFQGALELGIARYKYLTQILKAKPIPAGEGSIEVHMLLNHVRIYEALWSLYSFVHFSAKPCRIVIHDDGTLTDGDVSKLNKIFPRCYVIDRQTADKVVLSYFRDKGLKQCEQFRNNLTFALKLFDPFFFLKNNYFILLDSDVLFFAFPKELVAVGGLNKGNTNFPNLFFPDVEYQYCLTPDELTSLLGQSCIERINPGILRAKRGTLDFQRIEQYLQHPKFWHKDYTRHKYNAELTIWAMELTRSGAHPLPKTYAVCPDLEKSGIVSGHYCGSIYWKRLLYTQGLPRLAPILLG